MKPGPKLTPLDRRVWERIDKSGGPDACWPCSAPHLAWGYGGINVKGSDDKWGPRRLHRVVWELTNGPIPAGLLVCHTCDNPPCCNPAHLWLGTNAENLADMKAKGRGRGPSVRGEAHWSAKLTDRQVGEVRRRYAVGDVSQYQLADEYGVTQAQISNIIRGAQRAADAIVRTPART